MFDRVVTPHIERMLGGFHHRVACWLTGNQTWRLPDDRREYPPPLGGDEGGWVRGD